MGGSAGSGGLLAPIFGVWGAYDLADTVVDVASGKPLHTHVQENLSTTESTPDYYARMHGDRSRKAVANNAIKAAVAAR